MINFYKDEFDSKILGKSVFKLNIIDSLNSASKIRNIIKHQAAEIIFAFIKYNNKNIKIFEKLGFNLISIRNTYKYSQNEVSKVNNHSNNIFYHSKGKTKISKEMIDQLVNILLPTSRYFKDLSINKRLSRKIYNIWIKNSFFNKYADEIIFTKEKNIMTGFVSIKIKNTEGFIDLIGVLPEYQKKGYGSILIKEAIIFLKSKNVNNIFVITEGENIPANAFYQKNGFLIKNVELIYHKHYY